MRIEERRIWPPRLVSVFHERAWRPAHLLAWRRYASAYEFLVQLVARRDRRSGRPAPEWVDSHQVRPRIGRDDPPPGLDMNPG